MSGNEFSHRNYLQMTSEKFEEIFQLIKDGITKENTKIREPIPSGL